MGHATEPTDDADRALRRLWQRSLSLSSSLRYRPPDLGSRESGAIDETFRRWGDGGDSHARCSSQVWHTKTITTRTTRMQYIGRIWQGEKTRDGDRNPDCPSRDASGATDAR